VGAILPQIVPSEKLTRVNGINTTILSIVNLISPMVSAALLTITSLEYIFLIDVITAAAAISILLFFLQIPVHAKGLEKHNVSYFNDLHEGIIYIKNHRYVKSFFIFCAIFFFLVAPVAFLTPLQVTRSFGNDIWRLT